MHDPKFALMRERVEALKQRISESKSEKRRSLENEISTLENSYWLAVPWRRGPKRWGFWR